MLVEFKIRDLDKLISLEESHIESIQPSDAGGSIISTVSGNHVEVTQEYEEVLRVVNTAKQLQTLIA